MNPCIHPVTLFMKKKMKPFREISSHACFGYKYLKKFKKEQMITQIKPKEVSIFRFDLGYISGMNSLITRIMFNECRITKTFVTHLYIPEQSLHIALTIPRYDKGNYTKGGLYAK
jgi:hypothetical protein